MTDLNTSDPSLKRGFWLDVPSLLEPAPGPWMGPEIYRLGIAEAWEVIFGWLAAEGCNAVITHANGFTKHPIYMGWNYHLLLDFPDFPECRCFSPWFVEKNRQIIREVLDRGQEKGIEVFLHSYNNIAPKKFVEAHPSLQAKWEKTFGLMPSHDHPDLFDLLAGNLCIYERAFRDLMDYCYEDIFRQLPELAGLVITPGEHTLCQCDQCTMAVNNPNGGVFSKRRQRRPESGYAVIQLYAEAMKRIGRQGYSRVWYAGGGEDQSATKDLIYVVKYAMFDCIEGAAPDPLLAEWAGRGKGLWVTPEYHGENAGFQVWHDPKYFQDLGKNLETLEGVCGTFMYLNPWWSFSHSRLPVQELNMRAAARVLREGSALDLGEMAEDQRRLLGAAFEPALDALKTVSKLVLSLSSIFYLGGEGYTSSGRPNLSRLIHPPSPWPVCKTRVPPDWLRNGFYPVTTLGERFQEEWNGQRDVEAWVAQIIPEGERNPVAWFRQCAEEAASSRSKLEKWKPIFQKEGLTADYDLLDISLLRCEAEGRELHHLILAKLHLYAVEKEKAIPAEAAFHGRQCHEHFLEVVACTETLWESLQFLPAGTLHFQWWMRWKSPGLGRVDSSYWSMVEFRREELAGLETYLKELFGSEWMDVPLDPLSQSQLSK